MSLPYPLRSFQTVIPALICSAFASLSYGSDFASLDQALPENIDAATIAPVFDFDSDGCLPAAGISRNGDQNEGLKPTGSLTGDCRTANFLESSNTVHRYACHDDQGSRYCGHFYALYFEKDQILSGIESGHRHDWEYAAVWTINGVVTHGSYSAHGDLNTKTASALEFERGHLKIVYHKDGLLTHAMRFAQTAEVAENPYGAFVTPPIISWYAFKGDGWNNLIMRTLLNRYDYHSATLPMADGGFLNNLNEFKPDNYPTFTTADVSATNPGHNEQWSELVNNASGLCLDIDRETMASGTNVMLWNCSGGSWQQWYIDSSTGLVHSLKDPRYCLDNGGDFSNGANIVIAQCRGGDSQRFVDAGNGAIAMATNPQLVLDANGSNPGDNVSVWTDWGGDNQRWNRVQP
ncbi:NPP1 family protein [Gynuella sunshinyii]|uniref:Ricin B lectin domain-containing protein n=1 Tax=Gynuella sunshinyii YC6258 TaxID=1445510 RepID=A0A0C5VHH4_9GAMM|nr:NPP1 family protein [Gynuella sunshinyii]AJQ93706.1 hypothetical Protein YC6258_01659 [Gynuella sunshinyii YC6258]